MLSYDTIHTMISSELTYDEVREVAELYYKSLDSVFCPAINDYVSFGMSDGFHHIIHKSKGNIRDQKEQMMRFKLLRRGVSLIELTTTFQEFEESTMSVKVKINKTRTIVQKSIKYWGLIAIINDRKIKVILRKIGNGKIQFWSIIPAWTTSYKRDRKYIRMMKGDPTTD